MRIDQVFEFEIDVKLSEKIQALLIKSFPEVYPVDRIYFKQVPQFRFLAYNDENELVGQVGLDYRVMNLNGKRIRVLGVIDLCVSQNERSQGLGSKLLKEIDAFSIGRNIDFHLLFADNMALYLKHGYKRVENRVKWLKINDELQMTNGIGHEPISEIMIKEVSEKSWDEGELDLLGYLY